MYIYDFSIAKTFYSPPFTGGGAGGRGLPRYSRIERPKGFERCEAALNRAFGALNRPQAIERGFAAFERCVAALNPEASPPTALSPYKSYPLRR